MAFVTINTSKVAVGKKLSSSLLTDIVNNLNDLDARASGAEINTVTSNNTISDRESMLTQLGDTSGGAFTTTLPAASSNNGKELVFKKITSDGYNWTIDAAGSDQIEGSANQVLSDENEVLWIQSDGSDWYTITQISGTSKVNDTRTINTTSPITGGGDLSSDRTFSLELSDGYIWVGDGSNDPEEQQVGLFSERGSLSVAAQSTFETLLTLDTSKKGYVIHLQADTNATSPAYFAGTVYAVWDGGTWNISNTADSGLGDSGVVDGSAINFQMSGNNFQVEVDSGVSGWVSSTVNYRAMPLA